VSTYITWNTRVATDMVIFSIDYIPYNELLSREVFKFTVMVVLLKSNILIKLKYWQLNKFQSIKTYYFLDHSSVHSL